MGKFHFSPSNLHLNFTLITSPQHLKFEWKQEGEKCNLLQTVFPLNQTKLGGNSISTHHLLSVHTVNELNFYYNFTIKQNDHYRHQYTTNLNITGRWTIIVQPSVMNSMRNLVFKYTNSSKVWVYNWCRSRIL